MWRLDKEELTKVIVAEQTFTVLNSNIEIYKNKFCFSVDRDLIHITLQDSDIINKTICFDSLDFSYKFEINHNLKNIKASELVCDPVLYLNNLKSPVLYISNSKSHLDEDEQNEEEDYKQSILRADIKPKQYCMYFQDKAKGYFR